VGTEWDAEITDTDSVVRYGECKVNCLSNSRQCQCTDQPLERNTPFK